jgi:hypothetical protein
VSHQVDSYDLFNIISSTKHVKVLQKSMKIFSLQVKYSHD